MGKGRKKIGHWFKVLSYALFIILTISFFSVGILYLWQEALRGKVFSLNSFDLEVVPKAYQNRVPSAKTLQKYLKIHMGDSLFAFSIKDLRKKLSDLPWVRIAKVGRRFPDRLRIELILYQPKLVLQLEKLYYVDPFGKIFKTLELGDSRDFPIISGFDLEEVEKAPNEIQSAIKKTLLLMDYLEWKHPASLTLAQISEFHFQKILPKGWDISLILVGKGNEIRLGKGELEDYQRRLTRLDSLYREMGADLFESPVLDLRFRDRIVTSAKTAKLSTFSENHAIEIL